ncbi:hypothetical protein L6164_027978 [Bauhinia variegata]|uniref:Uncharacterized protein n=1 Tax=Bauhinia variegata TaxID=167791 RepID=A0ACB9LUT1_BAUVA|nr:hypothetical protein L6164_027978 [Bauhinia variegata]
MGFFRRIAGLLGFVKDDLHEPKDDADDDHDDQARQRYRFTETAPRKGFGVQVQVNVDRPHPGPIVVPCTSGDGGVQGLSWYAKRLRIDEDGDVADEFLDEVSSEKSAVAVDHQISTVRFKAKYNTRPAKVKEQVLSDGKLKQRVEHQGRLQWV